MDLYYLGDGWLQRQLILPGANDCDGPLLQDADGVAGGTLPEADAFEALHTGPYDTLENTYNAVLGRMQAEGLTPGDIMWEYYLSDPETEPDPAKWQTRVIWPVA